MAGHDQGKRGEHRNAKKDNLSVVTVTLTGDEKPVVVDPSIADEVLNPSDNSLGKVDAKQLYEEVSPQHQKIQQGVGSNIRHTPVEKGGEAWESLDEAVQERHRNTQRRKPTRASHSIMKKRLPV
uniref:Uncharacterized protein n=1 Tax=Chromera velia CCMP2878 TaxID=1169474 RepID=A0A0G4GVH2_9ALVE|eukprot:Cvel_23535.t1-p1 / transcript=Cvel_23535.t1 / gene=Cvel_23535 / organism=Chromera_velia_CCMP2878 / gene_product=hypothetical protein / transcript_product=hypothetical protein / location=Cvel_scaffold2436:9526-10494(-) / protein_length=124 / sequence_SO=supercontig / SO=protein_coding / is_pseudo=false